MVDKTGLDETEVDETPVDEIAVDEPGPHRTMFTICKERGLTIGHLVFLGSTKRCGD